MVLSDVLFNNKTMIERGGERSQQASLSQGSIQTHRTSLCFAFVGRLRRGETEEVWRTRTPAVCLAPVDSEALGWGAHSWRSVITTASCRAAARTLRITPLPFNHLCARQQCSSLAEVYGTTEAIEARCLPVRSPWWKRRVAVDLHAANIPYVYF